MAIALADFVNMNQTPMMKGLVQIITNTSIFLKRLNFIVVNGFAYRYNRETALGGIAFRNLNGYYNPTGKDDSVINPEIEQMAIFGGIVRTDRQLVLAQGDTVRASKIAAKIHKASLFFDKYCIQGDPATNSAAFMGLNARLTGRQLLSAGTNGGAVVLDKFVEAQDRTVGSNENKVLVCNKAVHRALSSQVRSEARGMGVMDASGTQIQVFNGSPVEVLDEDGDEQPILAETETMGSNSLTTSAYFINFGGPIDEQNVQGLVGTKMIEHVGYGERDGVYSDLIEGNMGMALFHPRAACRLAGLLVSDANVG